METNVKMTSIDLKIYFDFNGMHIVMTSIKNGKEIMYSIETTENDSWKKVYGGAKQYVLDGFMKTVEHTNALKTFHSIFN